MTEHQRALSNVVSLSKNTTISQLMFSPYGVISAGVIFATCTEHDLSIWLISGTFLSQSVCIKLVSPQAAQLSIFILEN